LVALGQGWALILIRSKTFIYTVLVAMLSSISHGQIRDVRYNFDAKKVSSIKEPLGFFRTFADYFYLLEAENYNRQSFVSIHWPSSGWCMGDAHMENFGTQLLRTGKPVFAVNDWDDAGPCPVILDFFRLAVSAVIERPRLNLEPLLAAYGLGQKRRPYAVPSGVLSQLRKSQKQGLAPSKKAVSDGQFVRTNQTYELRAEEKLALRKVLNLWPGYRWVDGIRTIKRSGGSYGLTRYQVLLMSLRNSESLLHLEFKEQTSPATLPVLRGEKVPSVAEKNSISLKMVQGNQASEFYGVFTILKKAMLLRPRFAGNDSWDSKEVNMRDFTEVVAYEAYLLGRQRADSELPSSDLASLKEDVRQMADFILKKYTQVVRP
jgi:hypothetical protein